MSHLFISYSHKDQEHLDNVINILKDNGVSDVWVDQSGIEGGEDWRNEIDIALEESFGALILLTSNSVKSRYVLYEWAWALGNNLPVLPIAFGEEIIVPEGGHPLYERKQYKNWNNPQDQTYVIDKVKYWQQSQPLDQLLGWAISEKVIRSRILVRVATWSFPYAVLGIINFSDYQYILEQARDETINCYGGELRDFWLEKASAFDRTQKRVYSDLVINMEKLWDKLNALTFVTQHRLIEDISHLHYEEKTTSELIAVIETIRIRDVDPAIDALMASLNNYTDFDIHLHRIDKPIADLKEKRFFSFFKMGLNTLSEEQKKCVEKVVDIIELSQS